MPVPGGRGPPPSAPWCVGGFSALLSAFMNTGFSPQGGILPHIYISLAQQDLPALPRVTGLNGVVSPAPKLQAPRQTTPPIPSRPIASKGQKLEEIRNLPREGSYQWGF